MSSPQISPPIADGDAADLFWDQRHLAVPASVWLHQTCADKVHRVGYTQGGNVFQYRGPALPSRKVCRGDRRPIEGFSGRSRYACLKYVNSINQDEVAAGDWAFGTFTYPASYPSEWKEWKRHLDNLIKAMERAFGPAGLIWKLEPQRRGAPHFHLMILKNEVMRSRSLGELVAWFASTWSGIVASGDPLHELWHLGKLGNGNRPCIETVRTWGGVVSYAGKYIGKECVFVDQDTGEILKAGRFWGKRRPELVPVRLVVRSMGERQAVQVRRQLRRYLEKQGREFRGCVKSGRGPAFQWIGVLRSFGAFIPSKVVERLVDWGAREAGELCDHFGYYWQHRHDRTVERFHDIERNAWLHN